MLKINKESIYKCIFFISIFLFVTGLGCKIYFCSSVAVKNNKVQDLFTRRTELTNEISRLSFIDADMSSLSYIENKALAMGFGQMDFRVTPIDPTASMQVASITR